MRNSFIFSVLVVIILSSFGKKKVALNNSLNQFRKEITLDTIKWWLAKIYTQDSLVQVPGTKAFIHFNIVGEKVNGNGSCNSFGGKVIVNGDQLSFGNFFSTKMYCNEVQPVENEFFRQLQTVTRYEIKGKNLILFNVDNAVLEFVAE